MKIKLKIEPRRDGRASSINVTVQKKDEHGIFKNERNLSLNSNGEQELLLEPGKKIVLEDSVSEDKATEKEARTEERKAGDRAIGGNTPALRTSPNPAPAPPRTGTPAAVAASAPMAPSRNTAAEPATPPVELRDKDKEPPDSKK